MSYLWKNFAGKVQSARARINLNQPEAEEEDEVNGLLSTVQNDQIILQAQVESLGMQTRDLCLR